jgi:hypothetical protein
MKKKKKKFLARTMLPDKKNQNNSTLISDVKLIGVMMISYTSSYSG